MELRTCGNCDRTIGHLEPEFSWQGQIVCDECHRRLVAAQQPPISMVAQMTPAVRRPRRPWPFWLAIALFVVATVPITVQFTAELKEKLSVLQSGSAQDLSKLSQSGGNLTVSLVGLLISVVNLVGFVAAWRGRSWGAVVAGVTAAMIVYMELGGMSITGLKPTALYTLGLVLLAAGYACLLLPVAWAYYRRCAEWRELTGA